MRQGIRIYFRDISLIVSYSFFVFVFSTIEYKKDLLMGKKRIAFSSFDSRCCRLVLTLCSCHFFMYRVNVCAPLKNTRKQKEDDVTICFFGGGFFLLGAPSSRQEEEQLEPSAKEHPSGRFALHERKGIQIRIERGDAR